MIDSNKPKKADQIVRFKDAHGSHNAGETKGCTHAEAALLKQQKLVDFVYFDDSGKDITAEVEKKLKLEAEALIAKKKAEQAAAVEKAKASAKAAEALTEQPAVEL